MKCRGVTSIEAEEAVASLFFMRILVTLLKWRLNHLTTNVGTTIIVPLDQSCKWVIDPWVNGSDGSLFSDGSMGHGSCLMGHDPPVPVCI